MVEVNPLPKNFRMDCSEGWIQLQEGKDLTLPRGVFEAWEERLRQQNEVLSTARARFFVVASQFCEDIKV